MTRIEQLAEAAAAELRKHILDAQDQIQAAIDGIMEDAQDAQAEGRDKAAVLSLSFGIKWPLDGSKVAVALGVSTRRKFESVIELDDPDQGKLPIDGIKACVNETLSRYADVNVGKLPIAGGGGGGVCPIGPTAGTGGVR